MSTKTLVIIPGWGGSKETWADFVALATPAFARVVVIELPCFGEVPCPESVWGVEEYTEYAKEQLKQVVTTDDQVMLLGHSFGGVVAANIVAQGTPLVDQLILSGSPLYRPKYYPKRIIVGAITKVLKVALLPLPAAKRDWIRKKCYRLIGSPDYAKTAGVKQEIFKKVIRQDTSANIPKLNIPTMVVWGSKDSYVPLRFGKKIAANLAQGTLTIIPDGPHGLHLKKQAELLSSIQSFSI